MIFLATPIPASAASLSALTTITEPIKAVGSQSVDTIIDGDADDIPSEDKVDEYSQEYFEKWERENTHW